MPGLNAVPVGRRFYVALLACGLAAFLFRGDLALSLVSRGDEFLTRGDVARARVYYQRAIRLDPNLTPAVDRFVFFGVQERTSRSLEESAKAASAYLARHPEDGAIRADRALCYQILKKYKPAASDFAIAAAGMRNPQYYTFAGWARYRLGDRRGARRLWTSALRIEPAYSPAIGALRRVGE